MIDVVELNANRREVSLKLVYYGPPLSGKTTNLQMLHRAMADDRRGDLTILDTADDRTLFFDLLPLSVPTRTGHRVRLKLYTVPGQVIHAATRRLVLAGADAVAYVADSRRSMSRQNNEFWHGMRRYLAANGLEPDRIPTVIQFNKRDLPEIRSDDEIDAVARQAPEPVLKATAIRGEGVVETFEALIRVLFVHLNGAYDFERRFGLSGASLLDHLFSDSRHGSPPAERGLEEAP